MAAVGVGAWLELMRAPRNKTNSYGGTSKRQQAHLRSLTIKQFIPHVKMSKYFLNCLVNSQDCLLKKSGIFDVTGAALCSLEELQLKIVFNIKCQTVDCWVLFPGGQILTLWVSGPIHQPKVSVFNDLGIRLNNLTLCTFKGSFWFITTWALFFVALAVMPISKSVNARTSMKRSLTKNRCSQTQTPTVFTLAVRK